MKINKLEQRIISILEPLAVENKHLATTSIIEKSQIIFSDAVT